MTPAVMLPKLRELEEEEPAAYILCGMKKLQEIHVAGDGGSAD